MKYRIGDYFSFQNGYAFKSKDFNSTQNGTPVIKIKEFNDNRIDFDSGSARIMDSASYLPQYGVKTGDILFALTGDPISRNNPNSWVGRVARYEKSYCALLNQRTCKAIKIKDGLEPDYLYYFFCNMNNLLELAAKATGSASQANISTKTIENTVIDAPDHGQQRRIVNLLNSLNAKISCNRRINDNLEAQASLLYEQVMASNESSCHTLGDIAEITSGKRPETKVKKASIENAIPIVGASDIMGFTSAALYNDKILVTGRVGTHGIIQRISTASWPSDNTLVIKSKYYEVVYQILRRVNYKSLNRGSTQPLITQKDLKSVEISLPSECKLLECENKLSSIMNLVDHNKLENNRLTTVRNYLLPLLMTGQISLED